jgi:hypothetical protein
MQQFRDPKNQEVVMYLTVKRDVTVTNEETGRPSIILAGYHEVQVVQYAPRTGKAGAWVFLRDTRIGAPVSFWKDDVGKVTKEHPTLRS